MANGHYKSSPMTPLFRSLLAPSISPAILQRFRHLTDKGHPNWVPPIKQWYGRETYLRVHWTSSMTSKPFPTIAVKPQSLQDLNTLASTMWHVIVEMDPDVVKPKANTESKRILLDWECYLDRNVVSPATEVKSGMMWHRDRMTLAPLPDDSKTIGIADYTMIVLLSPRITWGGGEIRLQAGGERVEESSHPSNTQPQWKGSEQPVHTLSLKPGDSVVFRNSDALHSVTPLHSVPAEGVNRDVLILTCGIRIRASL